MRKSLGDSGGHLFIAQNFIICQPAFLEWASSQSGLECICSISNYRKSRILDL